MNPISKMSLLRKILAAAAYDAEPWIKSLTEFVKSKAPVYPPCFKVY